MVDIIEASQLKFSSNAFIALSLGKLEIIWC